MASAVAPIHQPGLRSCRDFVENGSCCAGSAVISRAVTEEIVEDLSDPELERFHGVCTTAAADLGILLAKKAGPGRKSHLLAGNRGSVTAQNIHIEQTA